MARARRLSALFVTLFALVLSLRPTLTAGEPTDEALRALARDLQASIVAIPAQGTGLRTAGGSGVVVAGAPAGKAWILTSAAVVGLGQSGCEILTVAGRRVAAEVVARSPRNAAVLLAIPAGDQRPIPFGDSDALEVGQAACTLGNSFGSIENDRQAAFSAGVVSGRYLVVQPGRYVGEVLETDAAANPGAFGGALVDGRGRLIGLLDPAYDRARWLGTAIPAAQLRRFIDTVRTGQQPAHDHDGEIGCALAATSAGWRVTEVAADGPAEALGLRRGDVVQRIGNFGIADLDARARAAIVRELAPGTWVTLTLAGDAGPRLARLHVAPRLAAARWLAEGGYLGVLLTEEDGGQEGALIEEVGPDTPAAQAGLKRGDRVVKANGKKTPHGKALIALLEKTVPGEVVKLTVDRDGWEKVIEVKLGAAPAPPVTEKPFLGLAFEEGTLKVAKVQDDSPAAYARLKPGDVLVALDKEELKGLDHFLKLLGAHQPGDEIALKVEREGWRKGFKIKLAGIKAEEPPKKVEPPQPKKEEKPQPKKEEPPKVEEQPAAYLGVALSTAEGAVVIEEVLPGTAAEKEGLKKGDALLKVGDEEVKDVDHFIALVAKYHAGDEIRLTIRREGWVKVVKVKAGQREAGK